LLLQNARANIAVGLAAAFRMLLRVQEECEDHVSRYATVPPKVVVHVADLAIWAGEAGAEFEQAQVTLKSESISETKSLTVEVLRPNGERSWMVVPSPGGMLELRHTWSWPWMAVAVAMACLACVCLAIALGLELHLDFVSPLAQTLHVSPPIMAMWFGGFSALAIMVIGGMCCRNRYHHYGYVPAATSCAAPPVSCQQEAGPREPFLARRGYCQLREGQVDDAANTIEVV